MLRLRFNGQVLMGRSCKVKGATSLIWTSAALIPDHWEMEMFLDRGKNVIIVLIR